MTTQELMALLRDRYSGSEYQLLEQVPSGTGAHKTRTADAVAMGLWPSRGLHLYGFELKVSRGDFLREMKDPAKADAIGRRCHFWYVVTGDDKVARTEELPSTWGLLVARGGKLVQVKAATLTDPEPLDWAFLAGLIRALGREDVDAFQARLNTAMQEERLRHAEAMEQLRRQHAEDKDSSEAQLRRVLEEFREASGLDLLESRWELPKVGEVVKMLLQGGITKQLERLEWSAREIAKLSSNAEKTVQQVRELAASFGGRS